MPLKESVTGCCSRTEELFEGWAKVRVPSYPDVCEARIILKEHYMVKIANALEGLNATSLFQIAITFKSQQYHCDHTSDCGPLIFSQVRVLLGDLRRKVEILNHVHDVDK